MNVAANSAGNALFVKEIHSSAAWGMVLLLIPAIAFAVMASQRVIANAWLVFVFLIPLVIAGAAMAWSGFHYTFSPSGIEIRTLGFRLRSIPVADIRSYSVEPWNILGGYGIRGLGGRKAYVWGNRGVRIMTDGGWVFLGHDDPERIVRDLDLIKNHQGHEGHEGNP